MSHNWQSSTSKGKKGATLDPTVEFLRRNDTQAWLENPDNPTNRLPDDYMHAALVAQTALQAAEDKCFFHWELEFPEVFFAPSRPGGQDVQLREDSGFDAVVGNPPYGFHQIYSDEIKPFFHATYGAARGSFENYFLFYESSLSKLKEGGFHGYIAPVTWLTIPSAHSLRKYILDQYSLIEILWFFKQIFQDAQVNILVSFIKKSTLLNQVIIKIFNDSIALYTPTEQRVYEQEDFITLDYQIKIFESSEETRIIHKIKELSENLTTYATPCSGYNPYEVGKGEAPEGGPHTKFTVSSKPYHSAHKMGPEWKPEIVGRNIDRYLVELVDDRWIKYGPWLAAPREPSNFVGPRLLIQEVTGGKSKRIVSGYYEKELYYSRDIIPVKITSDSISFYYLLSLVNSWLMTWFHFKRNPKSQKNLFPKILVSDLDNLPIHRIDFTTPADERQRLTQQAIGSYDIGDNAGVLQRIQAHIDADKTDVVHDLLAHLAQCMIDLNKQKQSEVKRFLSWIEKRLNIRPKNDGSTGIDSLAGKTIIQNYLGDYQKGEDELPWHEFHYRLYQNRNRFAVSLSDVEGDIQREYETSLETLLPIKRDLARTDALIDKIVYRLYGLTDEEIELIERPQYEQALADAKSQVVGDEKIKDDEEKIEKIAEGILPAAKRFFERVDPANVEALLDRELPAWRTLPPDAPIFLITGDYNLQALPDHMDFSSSVIPYTKAVETVLYERIFAPFRDGSGCTDADCSNTFLKDFMRGDKKLTLGSFMIILSSSKETALRQFIDYQIPDAENRVFGTSGLVTILNDETIRDIRNKAAHDEVLSRDEAKQTRAWALQILELV